MIARSMPSLQLFCFVVLSGALFLAACTRAISGPKGLSQATYAATQKAVAALEAASQARNASGPVFDPKLQAASKAAEDVYSHMGDESSDAYVANQLRSCVGELKAYRDSFDSRESVSRPIEEQLKGLKGTQMKDATGVVTRGGQQLDECVRAAKSYL